MNNTDKQNNYEYIFDVGEKDFIQKVIEKSEDHLVLVDFWAPWCGPCKQLSPFLEKTINECDGKALLAKINIDENQQIASQLRIQSIPTVLAFKNKKIADAFQGVIPREKILEFIEKNLGESIKKDHSSFYDEIRKLIENNDTEKAIDSLEDFISENSEDLTAIQMYLNCLISLSKLEEVNTFISSLSEEIINSAELRSVLTNLKMKENNSHGPTLDELKIIYTKDSSNLKNILSLSEKYFANNMTEDAFELLLSEYKNHKDKEKIKKVFLKYFEALGNDHEKTKYYRKKFSSIVFA